MSRLAVVAALALFVIAIPAIASAETIFTVAGGGAHGDGGPGTGAQLKEPSDVVSMPDGSFLIADSGSHRIRRVGPDGVISTVAGTGTRSFGGDGGAARTAELDEPRAVASLPDGSFLIGDYGNDRVRRVIPDGTISTVAGKPLSGSDTLGPDTPVPPEGAPAVEVALAGPVGLAAGSGGFLVVARGGRGVLRVTPDGQIAPIPGPDCGTRDQPKPCQLSAVDVAIDPDGHVVVALSRSVARLNSDFTLTTLAPLRRQPTLIDRGIATTPTGDILVADSEANRILRISPEGSVTTVAGILYTNLLGELKPRSRGDGGPARHAELARPQAVSEDPLGGVLIADTENDRIRFVASPDTGRLAVAIKGERLVRPTGKVELAVVTTLPADATVQVKRGERRIATTRRSLGAGTTAVRLPGRLRPGVFTVSVNARRDSAVATDHAKVVVRPASRDR